MEDREAEELESLLAMEELSWAEEQEDAGGEEPAEESYAEEEDAQFSPEDPQPDTTTERDPSNIEEEYSNMEENLEVASNIEENLEEATSKMEPTFVPLKKSDSQEQDQNKERDRSKSLRRSRSKNSLSKKSKTTSEKSGDGLVYEKKLRGSSVIKQLQRRGTPATKPADPQLEKHIVESPKKVSITTEDSKGSKASDDEKRRKRSSTVRFDEETLKSLTDARERDRPSSSGGRRSSVRFSVEPDIILDEAHKRSFSSSPRRSSVSFSPSKSSTKFSFSGLPPEKGVWPFHKEPEGLALRFRSDDDADEIKEREARPLTESNESVFNLEFKRKTIPDLRSKRSVNRQILMEQLPTKPEQEVERRESTDRSMSYPVERQVKHFELKRDFGSIASSMMTVEGAQIERDSIMGDSTKELLQRLLPGMEEEEFTPPVEPEERYSAMPEVLDADNSLMEKFQGILKKHLISQIERLTSQCQDMNHDVKSIRDESKKIAEFIYKEERFVMKQKEDIETFQLKTDENNEKRILLDKDLEEDTPRHKAFISNVKQLEKQEIELRKERDLLTDLVFKLKEMETKKETELKFSKAESESVKKEKARLTDEKLKQDFLLWKLEKEVMRVGAEMDSSLDKTERLQEEIRCVSGLLSKADFDLNSKLEENKILQKSITESLKCIEIRDKELLTAKEKVRDAKNNWMMMINAINTYAKDVDKEISKSEHNTSMRKNLTEILEQLRVKIKKKENEKNDLDSNQYTLEKYLADCESNYEEMIKIGKDLKKEENKLIEEHLKQDRIFNSKKQEYFDKISTHKNNKNLIHNIEEKIQKLAEKNQEQEMRITESENALAKLMVECEEEKLAVNKNEYEIQAKQNEKAAGEQELRAADVKRKKMRDKVLNLTARIRMKKQKIKELELRMKTRDDGEDSGYSANARKLKILEKQQLEISKEVEALAKEWLEIQNQVLLLKEKRAHQVHEINITRKHNLTMENSKIRNDMMIMKIQSQIKKCKKEKIREEKALERWHQAAFQMNQKIENIKLKIIDLQNLFTGILKDSECEAMFMQKEHCELSNLIQEMTEELKEGHQELLEWEKKWNLAVEAKERIDKEREAGGEVATMRMEIHRMEVRFNQLKKAQEKVLNDLELCISRRDQIIDNTDAREKRSRVQGKQYSRVQLQRKNQELRNKLQQSVRTRKEIQGEIESAQKIDLQLREEYLSMKESVEALKQGLDQLEKQIEEGQVHQHSCLETTVMRQRKCKFLEELKYGKYRCLIKSGDAQVEERNKLEDELAFFYQVVESLKQHFPQLYLQLQQIENTITTDSLYLSKCDEEGQKDEIANENLE